MGYNMREPQSVGFKANPWMQVAPQGMPLASSDKRISQNYMQYSSQRGGALEDIYPQTVKDGEMERQGLGTLEQNKYGQDMMQSNLYLNSIEGKQIKALN